mgnify:CR=1 FL=1
MAKAGDYYMDNNNPRISIKSILDKLTEPKLESDTNAMDEVISSIVSYYRSSLRHEYNEITKYVMKIYSSISESEANSVIIENLDLILKKINEECGCKENTLSDRECKFIDKPMAECSNYQEKVFKELSCSECKELYRFIVKLKDHIALEFVRLTAIYKSNEELNNKLEEINKSRQTLSEIQSDIIEKVYHIEEDSKATALQMVSVLGIFATVVIAIFGGGQVIASISKGFNSINDKQMGNILIVSGFIAIFVINLVFSILSYITYLIKDKLLNKWAIIIGFLNIFYLLIICVCVL